MTDDRIIRSIFLLAAIAFALLVFGAYSAYHNLDRVVGFLVEAPAEVPRLKLPDGMKETRVVLGEDLLEKKVFYSDVGLGRVSDIRRFALTPDSEPLLCIIGHRTAAFLSPNRTPVRTVQFGAGRADRVVLVDMESDGNPEFLSRGSWLHSVVLFDLYGRERWNFAHENGVNDAAACDMDGDGVAEVVVGLNGFGGVHLLDARGNRLWRRIDGNVWQVAMVDVDGDGRCEIVHSNGGGEMTVRNARGKVVLNRDMETYFSDFAMTDWGPSRAPGFMIGSDDGNLPIIDLKGNIVYRLPAPDSMRISEPLGTTVSHPAGGVHYAALATFAQWNRTALYVYDTSLALVYREVLDGSCNSIAANTSGSGDTFLVGCENTVWEYSWKTPAAR